MNERLAIAVGGRVQGVGFRPFVARAAARLGLGGFVRNVGSGADIEVEGPSSSLRVFVEAVRSACAPIAVETMELAPREARGGADGFRILASSPDRGSSDRIPLDAAPCALCLAEMGDPQNRRFGYPFITCAACGPRFTIMAGLPFDRAATSMADFAPCARCAAEYADPLDRRFHAQTISCPACGPRLAASDGAADPIRAARELLASGGILALKGVGGYQLVADAGRREAVAALRRFKLRPAKPFAVMLASVAAARRVCTVDRDEERALRSVAAPIVILRRRSDATEAFGMCDAVAPGSSSLGVMLPASPLHHALAVAAQGPLLVTSGNGPDEPILTDDAEARRRLSEVATLFLSHDRRILHHADDSVLRLRRGRSIRVRLGRGLAPLALTVPDAGLAVVGAGGHEKSAFALATGGRLVLSQHIGDLDDRRACDVRAKELRELARITRTEPVIAVRDLHPDYATSDAARRFGGRVLTVQHHHAHVLACAAERGLTGPLLGVAWDGTGLGSDGVVWGGEVLAVDGTSSRRLAHLRPFQLPGGKAAVREPRRSALGVLHALFGENVRYVDRCVRQWRFSTTELDRLLRLTCRGAGVVTTTSAGRLFDAVASIVGVCQIATHDAEAPSQLEDLATRASASRRYELALLITPDSGIVLDWEPLVRAVLEDVGAGVDAGEISLGFHEALASVIATVAKRAGLRDVVLAGGVFQNALLTSLAEDALRGAGFAVWTHEEVPPGDGGLAVGQAVFGILAQQGGGLCV